MGQQQIVFPPVKQPEYLDSEEAKILVEQYQAWMRGEVHKRGGDALVALFFRVAAMFEQLKRLSMQAKARIIFSDEFKQMATSLKSAGDSLRDFFPYYELVNDEIFFVAEAMDIASRANPSAHPPDVLRGAIESFELVRGGYENCFQRCREAAQSLQQPAMALPTDQLLAKHVATINRILLLRLAIYIAQQKPEVRFEAASQFEVGPYLKEFPLRQVLGDNLPDLTSTMQMLTVIMNNKFITPGRAMTVFTNMGNLAAIVGDHGSAWSYYTTAVICSSNSVLPRDLEEAIKLLQRLEG